MIIAAVLIIVAVILAAIGVAVLVNARRRAPEAAQAPVVSQSLAEANQSAASLIAEARTAALHSHEAAMEEVKERLAAVEGRSPWTVFWKSPTGSGGGVAKVTSRSVAVGVRTNETS